MIFQDDYLDAFGDPSVTGKIGTDIEENKCSWLIMQALSRCNKNQESVLKVCNSISCHIYLMVYIIVIFCYSEQLWPQRQWKSGKDQANIPGSRLKGGIQWIRGSELRGTLEADRHKFSRTPQGNVSNPTCENLQKMQMNPQLKFTSCHIVHTQ